MNTKTVWALFFALRESAKDDIEEVDIAVRLRGFWRTVGRALPTQYLCIGASSMSAERDIFVLACSGAWERDRQLVEPTSYPGSLHDQFPNTPRGFTESAARYAREHGVSIDRAFLSCSDTRERSLPRAQGWAAWAHAAVVRTAEQVAPIDTPVFAVMATGFELETTLGFATDPKSLSSGLPQMKPGDVAAVRISMVRQGQDAPWTFRSIEEAEHLTRHLAEIKLP